MKDSSTFWKQISIALSILVALAGILGKFEETPLSYLIALLAVGLSLLAWMVIQRAQRNRALSRSILVVSEGTPAGFNGVEPYSWCDSNRFYGREVDIVAIIAQIQQDNYRNGVIYAESGVGKTSLIRAGLIPRLDQDYSCHYISFDSLSTTVTSVDDLFEFIAIRMAEKISVAKPKSFEDTVRFLSKEHGKGPVVFIDQFEQLLSRSDYGLRTAFARKLEGYCESRLFKLVISIRSDYFGLIYDIFKIERQFVYLLRKFNTSQAREVIRRSLSKNHDLEKISPEHPLLDFEDILIADLQDSDGGIHAVELSIICWMMVRVEGTLTKLKYIEGGRKLGWINRYLDEILKSFPRSSQLLQILLSLAKEDRSESLSLGDIASRTGLSQESIQMALKYMIGWKLIQVRNGDNQTYKITHEYMIEAIRMRSGGTETPVEKCNRLISSRAHAWWHEGRSPHHFLKYQDILPMVPIRNYLDFREDRPLKIQFLARTVRYRALISVVYILALSLLASSISYFYILDDAKDNLKVQAVQTAHMAANYLAVNLYFAEDDDNLINDARRFMTRSFTGDSVSHAFLFDQNGEILATYGNHPIPDYVVGDDTFEDSTTLCVVAPSAFPEVDGDILVGKLKYCASKNKLRNRLSSLLRYMMTASIITVLSSIAAHIILWKLLTTKPVSREPERSLAGDPL